jgi:hypothetical protein
MNLRWLLGDYSDPRFRLTREQQREVNRLAHQRYLSPRAFTTCMIIAIAMSWIVFGFAQAGIGRLLDVKGVPWRWGLCMIALFIMVFLSAASMFRRVYVRPIRRAMFDLGYDVCIRCGYRLEGLDQRSPHCPECGTQRLPAAETAPTRQPSVAPGDARRSRPGP